MSETEHQNIHQIKKLIAEHHAGFERKKTVTLAAGILALIVAFWGLFSLLEYHFYLEPAAKVLLWIGFFTGSSALVYSQKHLLNKKSFPSYYAEFCRAAQLPNIRHALDLLSQSEKQGSLFTSKAIEQNLSGVTTDSISKSLNEFNHSHEITRRSKISYLALSGGLLLFGFSLFSTQDTTHRMLAFWKTFDQPNPFTYTVTPGSTTIEQGSRFRAEVIIDGSASPDEVFIAQKTDVESDYRTRPMRQTSDSEWVSDGIELFGDMTYYLTMDGYKTETYEVNVQLIPRFQELIVTVTPPAYTRLDREQFIYPFNRIEAYEGSTLSISGKVNKEITTHKLLRHTAADTVDLQIEDDSIFAELTLSETDSVSFLLEDEHGLQNRNPFNFRLIGLEDQRPYVRIIQPEREKTGMNIQELNLTYDLEDDFGFTSVTLKYELHKAFTNEPVAGSISLNVPESRSTIERYRWDLTPLILSSMDELVYWIEVRDNDEINGYKIGRSEQHILRIQSLADYLFEQEEKEQNISESMDDIQDKYDRMRDEYERLREQVRDTPEDHWEQSQTMDQIEEQRRELEEQIEQMRQEFEELQQEMMQDGGLSEETMERYKELQELMKEIDDPEIMRMLEELQENLSQMSQQQMREALDQLEFNEDRYRERLDRTVELFKQLRLNSDLTKAERVLEELKQQEQRLSEMEEYGEQEAEQQEQIKQELERLAEKLDELPEKAPRRHQEMMEELNQQLQEQMEQTGDQLQENIDKMKDSGPTEEIRMQQQDISQQMEMMTNQLNESMDAMNQEQAQINLMALQNILQSIILISEEQEDILRQTSGLRDQSAAFVELARRERNALQSMNAVADSLLNVAAAIPQLSNRINTRRGEVQRYMNHALEYMIERQRNNSTNAQRMAMAGLNQIGTMLADLIDQLQDQSGGGGGGMSAQQMMEQMQDMSGQQQQLNQQIQDFINDMQGDRLNQDQMERLDQMARQQNQLREQMRNLQRNGGLQPGDEAMSELERLGEEMEDAINDLRGGNVDQLMVRRQQNILSRMLETERSLHERDQDEERREGDEPGEYDISSAPELTMQELQQKIRSGLQDPNQTRFNEDYQRLIERYFEILREMDARQNATSGE